MKRKLSVLFVFALIATACVPAVAPATPAATQTPWVITAAPPPNNPSTAANPPAATDPPMITISGIGSYDCRPYPSFKFLYIAGIDDGESVPVLAKAEPQLSEPGVDWWQVRYEEGGATVDCWVYGGTKYVVTSGDFSDVKINPVIIPTEAPKPHCDTDVRLAKIYPGVKVTLPYKQAPYRGHTGWFDGMSEYSGKHATVTAFAGLDLGWCQTVYVDADGGQYPWRIRDLTIGWKKGD